MTRPWVKQVTAGVGVMTLNLMVMQMWHYSAPFLWHPILMTVGFAVLMAHGVLIAMEARAFPGGEQRVTLLRQHMWTQILACACIVGGLIAILYNKVLLHKPHFATRHGGLGLSVVLMTLVTPMLGALSFRSLGVGAALSEVTIARLKQLHRMLGSFVCMAGCFTAGTGAFKILHGWAMYATLACIAILMGCLAHHMLHMQRPPKPPQKIYGSSYSFDADSAEEDHI